MCSVLPACVLSEILLFLQPREVVESSSTARLWLEASAFGIEALSNCWTASDDCSKLSSLSHTTASYVLSRSKCISRLRLVWPHLTDQFAALVPSIHASGVVSLQLVSYALKQTMPDFAGLLRFHNLEELSIHALSCMNLSVLANCTKLRTLECLPSPDGSLSALSRLTNLISLRLTAGGMVQSLTPLESLKNLRVLHLEYSHLMDRSSVISLNKLERLEEVGLSYTDWITSLPKWPHVESLVLNSTAIEDVSALVGNESLRYIDLSRSPVLDLEAIRYAVHLKALNMSSCLSIDSIGFLNGFTDLVSVDISCTLISDLSPLQAASQLQHLNISKCPVADISAVHVDELRLLWMPKTLVSDLSSLMRADKLEVLDISYSRVRTHSLSSLKSCRSLKRLSCHNVIASQAEYQQLLTCLPEPKPELECKYIREAGLQRQALQP
eukprot:GILJ01008631.1.p1 GENE.GILJ01008631.1~~GILJ01008631.1.p1  ORF type:complete len:441 (-),score=33.19 GILJ01008631.1:102-1424(-)